MGLDMYAVRRVDVKRDDYQPPDQRFTVTVERRGQPVLGLEPERISTVEVEDMYWRKANHIHSWFVSNIQRGNDNCAIYYVPEEKLRDLMYLCDRVIDASELVDGMVQVSTEYSKEHPKGIAKSEPGKVIKDATVAADLLPVCEGFFFGSQEYDEDYLQAVIDTRDWIARVQADRNEGICGPIFYASSW